MPLLCISLKRELYSAVLTLKKFQVLVRNHEEVEVKHASSGLRFVQRGVRQTAVRYLHDILGFHTASAQRHVHV